MLRSEPEWYILASRVLLPSSRIKIRVQCDEETHDGYCSDPIDCQIVTTIEDLYLPSSSLDLGICEWEVDLDHCDCCQAKLHKQVISIERLTPPPRG